MVGGKKNTGKSVKSRKRRWGLRLSALLIGLVLTSLLAEGLVLLALGEQAKFPRHVVGAPWGLRYNEPGSHYRHKSADVTVWFQINQQGLRADREFSYDKPDGVSRIVSLGDSFTIGYEVDLEDTFTSVLERELKTRGVSVEAMNAGVSGFSTAEECLSLEREWIKYQPDLVLVSWFPNDLVDNVRTNLFRFEGDTLLEAAESYIPAGGFGNFLNRNRFFNLLSERSNAFVFLKETATRLIKRRLVKENQANINPNRRDDGAEQRTAEQSRLAAAIFERIYRFCNDRGVKLVIHSIPADGESLDGMFPHEYFNVQRPGLLFVDSKDVLAPHAETEPLYFQRSHFHWTPFCHRLAGEELTRRIVEAGFLQ